MLVTVTDEDITQGEGANPYCCPIALALNRLGFLKAKVGVHAITLYDDVCINLPSTAKAFAYNFDMGREMLPITFELEVPSCR